MKLFFVPLLLFCTNFLFPDRAPYSEKINIRIESKNYYITHFHNWSKETKDERYRMMTKENQNIFENNNYAYIEIFRKETNEKIIRIPSPALTDLFISDDEQYIAGISQIMIDNPYQLIVIKISGEIIKIRHIAPIEAKMNENDFNSFKNNFPVAFQYLQSKKRIYKIASYYFIDFYSLGMPVFLGNEAFSYLLKYETVNHLSNNISSSVTNWIFWFNEENPNIRFNYRDNELYSINLLDPENVDIELLLNEN
jgi:hypothetical protein